LVTTAVNQALTKSRDLANKEMSKVTGGLNLPNIPGLF
ncbi:MAG TPA: YbaB/EbfC family nucleoid-associated protein, partial [Desulfobacteria bacterium]|nr:YbaB/EbfC family nucleoid-associated protein [Desulfobacteria bacterium]